MQELMQDFNSLINRQPGNEGSDRRDFLQTALGVGFAAAALPVMAQNIIKTDTAGLTAGEVTLTVKGQQFGAYRAMPEGKSNLPVIIVVSEIFGVHEHIADVARRFAKQGYLAIAPQLFVRQGDAANQPSVAELIKNVVSKVPDAQVMQDLDACVAWAKENGGNTAKLGITGFCWGGRITWLYAAHNPAVKAGVAWYGKLVGDKTELTPQHPLDVAGKIKARMLGLYGAKDTGIGLDSVEKMNAAMTAAGNKAEFVIFPNSGHAFHADYRPSYVEADAKEGWGRCLAWFRENGVA